MPKRIIVTVEDQAGIAANLVALLAHHGTGGHETDITVNGYTSTVRVVEVPEQPTAPVTP